MIAVLLPLVALGAGFLYVFVSQGALVLKAWRTGVIAGDSLLKEPVERAVAPAEFARVLGDKVRRLVAVVGAAMILLMLTWPVLGHILKP